MAETTTADARAAAKISLIEHFFRRFFDTLAVALVLVISAMLARFYGVLPDKFEAFGVKGEFVIDELEDRKIQFAELAADFDARISRTEADLQVLADKLEANGDLEPAELASSQSPGQSSVLLRQLIHEVETDKVSRAIDVSASNTLTDKLGYVWLGTYDDVTGAWLDASVSGADGTRLSGPPDKLPRDGDFNVLTDLNLRDGAPERNERYFRDQAKLGIVPEGETVTLKGAPLLYPSETGWQIWGRVDAPVRPLTSR